MGISSNQARFLALTSRQVDLENRVQQICQRRLRLSSELEKVATDYNNQIGNRQMFTFNSSNSGIRELSISGIQSLKDTNGKNYILTNFVDSADDDYYSGIRFTTGVGFEVAYHSFGDDHNKVISLQSLGLSTSVTESEALDVAIRSGVLVIMTESDSFTQEVQKISYTSVYDGTTNSNTAKNCELRDWRTLPDIADELYKGDDVAAENKYDRTIAQVNAQDKKLQLEQSSIEVEYKAVTSEKEAVKKILDTNASASFKYFS